MPLATLLDLPVFEGPLDLLLTLVERRRLAITDVSLAVVADQYLEAVRSLPEPNADVLGEFLVIAARLLLLKSRALLPQEEGGDEEETPDELTERLEAYRRFKEAASRLGARFEAGAHAFPRPARPELHEFQPDLEPIEAQALAQLWRSISRRQPPPPAPDDIQPRATVAERLALLRQLLSRKAAIDWQEVAGRSIDETIATFLAVLELVRRGEIRVRQDCCFGPIRLEA